MELNLMGKTLVCRNDNCNFEKPYQDKQFDIVISQKCPNCDTPFSVKFDDSAYIITKNNWE